MINEEVRGGTLKEGKAGFRVCITRLAIGWQAERPAAKSVNLESAAAQARRDFDEGKAQLLDGEAQEAAQLAVVKQALADGAAAELEAVMQQANTSVATVVNKHLTGASLSDDE